MHLSDLPTIAVLVALCFACYLFLNTMAKSRKRRNNQHSQTPVMTRKVERSAVSELQQSFGPERVYHNVYVKHEDMSATIEEVHIRENGIFVIMRNRRSGRISGHEEDSSWVQTIAVGEQPMRNPVKAIKFSVFLLSKNLKDQGISDWIQGIVAFTIPSVELNFEGTFPVVKEKDLPGFLQSYEARRLLTKEKIEQITKWLDDKQRPVVPSLWTEGESEEGEEGNEVGPPDGIPAPVSETMRSEEPGEALEERWSKLIEIRSKLSNIPSAIVCYEKARTAAMEHDLSIDEYRPNIPIPITKLTEPACWLRIETDFVQVTTYKADEAEIRDFLVSWLNKMGFVTEEGLVNAFANLIDLDAADRTKTMIRHHEGIEMRFEGSTRYGFLKVELQDEETERTSNA